MTSDAATSPAGAAVDAQNPWPGLEAFTERDQNYFYGRETEVDELHRLVVRERLTILFGVSGLGKTSLLQAGLFPVLRHENVLPVRIRLNFSEGMPDLSSQIKDTITAEAKAASIEAPSLEGTLWESFHRVHADFWSARNRVVTPLLVFDQFEEVFTRGRETPDRARDTEALLIELGDLIEGRVPAAVKARIDANPKDAEAFAFQRHNYKVLLSLREDFLADLESLRHQLPSVVHNRLRLCSMNGGQALAAVTRAGGPLIDKNVAMRVVAFVGAASTGGTLGLATLNVEPALLSVFCRELNLTRIERREATITAELLEGRQTEILTSFYERGLAGIGSAMRTFIEDRLVTAGGRRNSEPYEEAVNKPGVTAGDISLLVNRRILRIEERARMPWLELTHDRLTGVVRASRDSRRRREAQEQAEAAEREAQAKATRTREELLKKTRTLRLVRGLLAAAVVGLVAAVAGALFGFREERRAQAAAAAAQEANRAAQEGLANSNFERARDLVDADHAADALPYLSSAMRLNPRQPLIQAYTLSLLSRRNWPLPLKVIRGDAEFEDVELSPDGALIVTAARDGRAQIWGALTGTRQGPPLVHRGVVTSVGFSADNRLVSTSSEDGSASVWRADNGQRVCGPLVHHEGVLWAGLSTDATRLLTVAADGAATLWDVATGKVLFDLRAERDVVTVARLSRDGRFAVTGLSSGLARIWELAGGKAVAELRGHDVGQRINDAQFSPDGRRVITTSADSTARIWDVRTGAAVGAPMRHKRQVWDADFSPDGTLVATASDDGTVGLWSAQTGVRSADFMRHAAAAYTIEFSPDGRRLVTASADYTARVWDVATGHPITERMRHGDWLDATFSADGTRVITASWDKTLREWDVRPSASAATPMRHETKVTAAQFSPKGRYVVTILDNRTARVWDAETLRALSAPLAHHADVTHAEFSPDESRLLTVAEDGSAFVWSGTNWSDSHPLGQPPSLGFSADWTRALTAASDREVRLLDVHSGQMIGAPFRHDGGKIVAANLNPTGTRAVTIADDGHAGLWNTADGKPVGAMLTDRGGIRFAQFSPDGKRLLTASKENTARVWNAENGQAIGGSLRHYDWVTAADFNADGSRAVTASRDTAYIWNVATGEIVGQPLRHKDDILSVHFSGDGTMIVTASDDQTARVWDAETGQPESEPLHHAGPVRDAEFNAAGDRVVTASDDGTAHVWDVLRGSPDDANALAALAEAVGGSMVTVRGAAGHATDQLASLARLRHETASASGPGISGFIRWFLADRAVRPSSPRNAITTHIDRSSSVTPVSK